VGTLTYELDLLASSYVHPMVHVSQIKSFTPTYIIVFSKLPHSVDLAGLEISPTAVLDRRMVRKGNHVIVQVLV
jgi:hypothetical protein